MSAALRNLTFTFESVASFLASLLSCRAAVAGCVLLLGVHASPGYAQPPRPVIVDQTGLPIPGVRIDVYRGTQVVQSMTSGPDGTFQLDPGESGDIVEAALEGFETIRVPRVQASRIVLPIGRASDVTEVVASALTSSGSAMEQLGSTMSAPLARRLPTPRPHILQALPLLPGVVRGRDGLLRIGGTRPHESKLWIDGFDVTDPITGTTAIDLPDESVKGMGVVRDPVAATFGGVLGSMASIETTTGSDKFQGGVQGFIPRPRLNSQYGLGRIEAFFPRAYASGRAGSAHYFASTEFNFERVPVPGVTSSSGSPASGATGVVSFARMDFDISPRQTMTFEGLYAPGSTAFSGLSPLQQPEASPDIESQDLFGGFVDRLTLGPSELLTVRIGWMRHDTTISAGGAGPAILQPDGFSQNWFSAVDTTGSRRSASVTWDRGGMAWRGAHTVSVSGNVQMRTMSATMSHQPLQIEDDLGRLMRSIQFAPLAGRLEASDEMAGIGVRDVWDVNPRLQLDLNARLDWSDGSTVASPRLGLRYLVNADGRTTLKASAGRFVGLVPLGARTFGQFPARFDTSFSPTTGLPIQSLVYQPGLGHLELPRADGVALEIEQRVRQGLDLQASVRQRRGSVLPTVAVSPNGGTLALASDGTSLHREFQVSLRQVWRQDAQFFVSYVRSASTGDVNDFGSTFTTLDAPLLEPGGTAPTSTDVPHRLRAWATFGLPNSIVVSPSVDWRSGFPYTVQDGYRHNLGALNGERFPQYFAADLTVFKTFDVLARKMDLGLQVFNFTGHFNPRDVITVAPSAQFGQLTNNLGVTFGGYMQIRW